MARALVFDPTAGDRFVARLRRYDGQLLRDGHVHRYDDGDSLRSATGELTRIGYLVHELDATGWTGRAELHDALAGALSLPPHYGRNLDALLDVLRDVAEYEYGADPATTGTVLAVDGFDRVVELDARLAHGVLDVFAQAAGYGALLNHPMLCLVTATGELDDVGATAVTRARPPSPPR
jgi:hypothetical protein